jgi:hypothetical protein
MDPLVEDENERPAVEVIEALLGKRLKVRLHEAELYHGACTALYTP